jgi:hypothetical protein
MWRADETGYLLSRTEEALFETANADAMEYNPLEVALEDHFGEGPFHETLADDTWRPTNLTKILAELMAKEECRIALNKIPTQKIWAHMREWLESRGAVKKAKRDIPGSGDQYNRTRVKNAYLLPSPTSRVDLEADGKIVKLHPQKTEGEDE